MIKHIFIPKEEETEVDQEFSAVVKFPGTDLVQTSIISRCLVKTVNVHSRSDVKYV